VRNESESGSGSVDLMGQRQKKKRLGIGLKLRVKDALEDEKRFLWSLFQMNQTNIYSIFSIY
jgi:hypothetical protein